MVTKVLDIRPHEFTGDNNEQVQGNFIYLLVTKENGAEETRRIFASDDRMAEWAYIPKLGDRVVVFASNGKVVDMLKA